jgi:hypothetical protein
MVMEYEEYATILKAGGQPAMKEYTKQFFILVNVEIQTMRQASRCWILPSRSISGRPTRSIAQVMTTSN